MQIISVIICRNKSKAVILQHKTRKELWIRFVRYKMFAAYTDKV